MPSVQQSIILWVWKLKPHPCFLFFSSVSLLYSRHPSPRSNSQHSGKESIITTETRASWMNLCSAFESMWVRNKVVRKIRDNRVFGSPDLWQQRAWENGIRQLPWHQSTHNNPPAVKRGLRVHVRERQTEKDRMTCDCVCLAFQHHQAVLNKWFNNKDGLGLRWREFGPVDRTVTCSVGQLLHCHYRCF